MYKENEAQRNCITCIYYDGDRGCKNPNRTVDFLAYLMFGIALDMGCPSYCGAKMDVEEENE